MKKELLTALFTLALMLAGIMGMAQTSVYHPFPDSNAYWNQSDQFDYYIEHPYTECIGRDVYSLFIKGDTTIGVNNYNKIFSSGYNSSNCGSDDWLYLYEGAIRQDTLQKELFIFQPGDSSEWLLYDFNLALGDTLMASFIFPSDPYDTNVVSAIDSVLIGSNYRKRFWLSPITPGQWDSNYVALIEGVGSTFGFIAYNRYYGLENYELNCFNQDGQTLYPDSTTSCHFYTGINELLSENIISLYPNPATNQLTITTSLHGDEWGVVSIVNLLGQGTSPPAPLQRRGGSAVIDVSGLRAGMYFLQLKTEQGSVVKRFVKE